MEQWKYKGDKGSFKKLYSCPHCMHVQEFDEDEIEKAVDKHFWEVSGIYDESDYTSISWVCEECDEENEIYIKTYISYSFEFVEEEINE